MPATGIRLQRDRGPDSSCRRAPIDKWAWFVDRKGAPTVATFSACVYDPCLLAQAGLRVIEIDDFLQRSGRDKVIRAAAPASRSAAPTIDRRSTTC
jgi:hypothetical protein